MFSVISPCLSSPSHLSPKLQTDSKAKPCFQLETWGLVLRELQEVAQLRGSRDAQPQHPWGLGESPLWDHQPQNDCYAFLHV